MADGNFIIDIQGDTKDLLSNIKQAANKLDSFGKQGVAAVNKPNLEIQRLASTLSNVGNIAKTALAGLVGGIGIKSLTKDFMDYHANLSNAVQVMGYDVTQVEALGGAMRRFGGDTSGAISSLDSLSSALQQARFGQGALIETGAKFGIQYMKTNGQLMSSEELLQSLSKQLNKYDKQTKIAIASQLGLDSALLRVIDSGNFDTMIASQKKLNTTTKEDLKIATDLESAWLDFKDSISAIAKQISRALIPVLTKVLKFINNLMQGIADFKGKTIIAWSAVGVAVVGVVGKAKTLLTTVQSLSIGTKILEGMKVAAQGLGIAFKSAFGPLSLIFAIISVIALLAEDLYVYSQGGDSVIGDLANQFPQFKSFVDGMLNVFATIRDGIARFFDFLKDPSWDKFKSMVNDLAEFIKGVFINLWNGVKDLPGQVWKSAKGFFGDSWEWVKSKTGFGEDTKQLANTPSKTLENISNSTANNTSKITNNEITVNNIINSGNAEEVKKETMKGIEGSIKVLETKH